MAKRYSKKYVKEFEGILKDTWYNCGTLRFQDWEELAYWLGLPFDDNIKKATLELYNSCKCDLGIDSKSWTLDYIDF